MPQLSRLEDDQWCALPQLQGSCSGLKLGMLEDATEHQMLGRGSCLSQSTAELIIWDEAPMMHKHVLEYFDRTLRDVTRVDALFGGKVLILGGGFRQSPTVILRGSQAQVCAASLKRAYFWPAMQKMEFKINMRVHIYT